MSSSPPRLGDLAVPRGARRRTQIIDVAERTFKRHGFTATTMRMVAAEAGASKETLYRHFGSKEELFAQVVEVSSQRLSLRLDTPGEEPQTLGDVLRDLGMRVLKYLTSRDSIALIRSIVAEAQHDPALGRLFYANGPERLLNRLIAYLQGAQARGEFKGDSPERAAKLFLGAIMAEGLLARLLLVEPPVLSAAEIAARVDESVAMFLRHYH